MNNTPFHARVARPAGTTRSLKAPVALALSVAALVLTTVASTPGTTRAGHNWKADRPVGEYLHGMDVSQWQGKLDYAAAARQGLKYVYVRATYASEAVDPLYWYNRREAAEHGLHFGAYHFAKPNRTPGDGALEADFFLDNARLRDRHLLPVLDLERTNGLSGLELRQWIKDFITRVYERTGVRPMVYTSAYVWRTRTGDWLRPARTGHPLWIAHWDVAQPSVPASNWNGNGYAMWQWTDCGHVGTSSTCVDQNVFPGTSLRPLKIWYNRQ